MKQVDKIKSKGRYGDTELVHMTKGEVNALAKYASEKGRPLTKNPKTGLMEAYSWDDFKEDVGPVIDNPVLNPTNWFGGQVVQEGTGEIGIGGDDGLDYIDQLGIGGAVGGATVAYPYLTGGGAGGTVAATTPAAAGSSATPWLIGGSTLASLYGTKQATDAAEEAARYGAEASRSATAENARQFDITQANLAPWLQAGTTALGAQQSLMGLGGESAADVQKQLELDPGYQFRLKMGQKSLDSGLAARGGMGSGRALTAGVDYNQGMASQEYGNRLNRLATLSGTGQTTGQNLGILGANYAANQGNVLMNNANFQGSAGIAKANARQSGLSNLIGLGGMAYGSGMFNGGGGGGYWSGNKPSANDPDSGYYNM